MLQHGGSYNLRVAGRHPQRNIILIGFHKCGKTTVGRELARRLHRPFLDLQLEAQRRQRLSLYQFTGLGRQPDIVDLERKLIADLALRRETVAALACDDSWDAQTLDDLKVYAYVVFLDPQFSLLWPRIEADPELAPLVLTRGQAGMEARWRARHAEFEQCDLQLVDGQATPRRLVQLILHCFYT